MNEYLVENFGFEILRFKKGTKYLFYQVPEANSPFPIWFPAAENLETSEMMFITLIIGQLKNYICFLISSTL
ncbi:MAG TPA: hypothetical protein DCY42_09615 [Chloroflexi bacterium]|nr:hypothetical protein [Chloroflexota bacterium]